MDDFPFDKRAGRVSRRGALKLGASAAGAVLTPNFFGQAGLAFADDKPAMGTWPAGSAGDSVTIGAAVPLTGTYAAQGADELKGMELAVEHINQNHPLMKAIAPKVDKGVLGKTVKLVSADSAAKPNQAVQGSKSVVSSFRQISFLGCYCLT